MGNNELYDLINKVQDGYDYDIAKLFIHVFPECTSFTDKDISVKLSEDICVLLQDKQAELLRKTTNASEYEQCSYYSKYKDYDNVIVALRTHNKKKQYIAEIKSIR